MRGMRKRLLALSATLVLSFWLVGCASISGWLSNVKGELVGHSFNAGI